MHITNTICDEIEKFRNVSLNTGEQHVDTRNSQVAKDNVNISKLIEWFTLHNLFPNVNQNVFVATGIFGDNKTNYYNANEIRLYSIDWRLTTLNWNFQREFLHIQQLIVPSRSIIARLL